MKNNINKKISATLLSAAIMAGTAVIPMSNAAVEAKVNNTPSIKISAHVQDLGWMDSVEAKEGNVVGTFWQQRRVEAMKFDLRNCPGVTLSIVAHVQDHGDMEFTVGAEDFDKMVGTQWEQRRMEAITITSNGLHEQGFKLQYKAHVQDHGWQDWVEEGEMAGTRWEQRRVEAIEMRIVAIDNVAAVKTATVAKLNSYDTALKSLYINTPSTYAKLSDQITLTINEINTATTAEAVENLFNNQVKGIERYLTSNKTIEDVVVEETEKLNNAVETINEKLAEYEAYMPKSEYTATEKQKVSTVIAETRTKIANAKIADDIRKINEDLATLLTSPNIASDVATYKKLVEEQNDAYAKIAIYEEVIASMHLVEPGLTTANAAISSAKIEVAAAKQISTTTPSTVAGDVEKAMTNLETKLGRDIVAKATSKITENELASAKAKAKAALAEFVNSKYTDIQKDAQKFIEDIDKAVNTTAVSAIVTLDNEGTIISGTALAKTVTALANAETAEKEYDTAKGTAISALNATLDAIEELKVSEEKAKAISDMVDVYKASMENVPVSTVAEIQAADTTVNNLLSEFNNTYMATMHADIAKDVLDCQFSAAKDNALLVLNRYVNSDIADVKRIATNAKTTIEGYKVASQMSSISTTLNSALDDIELATIKNDAEVLAESLKAELAPYKNYDAKYNVSTTASIAINNINVELYTIKAISSLSTANQQTIDTCIYNMKNIKTTALNEITKKINENSVEIAQELKKAKELASKEINLYIQVASGLEDGSLVAELSSYLDLISRTNSKAVVDGVATFAETVLTETGYISLKINTVASGSLKTLINTKTGIETRVNNINKINAIYDYECYNVAADGTVTVKNAELLADTELKAKIATAINNLKSVKDSEGTTIVPETVLSNAITDITNTKSSYSGLTSARNAAKGNITLTVASDASVEKKAFAETLKTEVLKQYIDTIDAVTLAQFTSYVPNASENIFKATEDAAIAAVKAYIEDNMKAYARDVINAKIQAAIDAGKTPVEAKTADAFINTNNAKFTLTGATTDNLVSAAKTAYGSESTDNSIAKLLADYDVTVAD